MLKRMKKNNDHKLSVFCHKQKTRDHIKNLRHSSLNLNVIKTWLNFFLNVSRGNGNIHV